MRSRVPSVLGAALWLASLLPGAGADEAVLADGGHRPGTLSFAAGRLLFQPAGSTAPLPLADLHAVRCTGGPTPPLLVGRAHRVLLPRGQAVTGQLLGLDEVRLRLRTAWAESVAVPRPAVAAVTQLPGWNTFFAADFGPGLPGWHTAGAPALGSRRSPAGQHCLVLNRAGQEATHDLSPPVEAGWFAVDFHEEDEPGRAAWQVEAAFGVRVTIAATGEGYAAEVPGVKGTAARLGRTPGWHRLRMDFAPDALAVTLDDTALWYAEGRGPGGPLRQVRLACAGGRGAVVFADVSVTRPLPEVRHPPGDPGQDEVWLVSGDQVFGQVPRADDQAVELRGPFGKRTLPWGEVRGVFLHRLAPPAPAGAGRVRVRFWPGAGEEYDELVGTVRGLDERRLTLDHPLLGECPIERARLREVKGEQP